MCDIIHRRQYTIPLRYDFLFNVSSMSKEQEKLLATIHGLTSRVIQKKKEEVYESICSNVGRKQKKPNETESSEENKGKSESNTNAKNEGPTRMHYVRDDLDDIDDNDVGEKKRLAFLDLMLELSRNGAKLSDEEIKEEVDTIMFEVTK